MERIILTAPDNFRRYIRSMETTKKIVILTLSLMLFGGCYSVSAGELDEACEFAYSKLKSVSSAEVNQATGTFTYRDQHYQGCIIKLTADRTKITDAQFPAPLFYPFEDSATYMAGWRADIQSEADGPDGTVFRIVKGNAFCVVEGKWDGGDDSDKKYVPSTKYEVIVQCSSAKD